MTSAFNILLIPAAALSSKWYGVGRGASLTGFMSGFTWSLIWRLFRRPSPWNFCGYCWSMLCTFSFTEPIASLSIMRTGWNTSGDRVNLMMPSCRAEFPESIGSQDPEIMCHSTGTDVDPNVTAHQATPSSGIGELLYGFNFTWLRIIRVSIFQRFAWTLPHTETFAPVSAMGFAKELLTITGARKSLFTVDLQLFRTLFLVRTENMLISYSNAP